MLIFLVSLAACQPIQAPTPAASTAPAAATTPAATPSLTGDWEGHLQGVADELAPIRRFGTPEELAHFFVFLCSERASYSVGSTYFVDGGMLRTV